MLKNYKFIIGILVIVLICGVVVIELTSFVNEKSLKELDNEYDTRLKEFLDNERTAKGYLEVLTINNNQRYQEVKKKLGYKLDIKLQDEIFRHTTYPLQDTERVSYTIRDIKGTIGENVYTYKIEYIVEVRGFKRSLVTLIDIEGGLITKVTTL